MKRQLRGRLSNRDKRPLIVSNMANKTKLELNSIEMIMYGVLKHQTQKFQLDERHSLSIDTRLESLAKVYVEFMRDWDWKTCLPSDPYSLGCEKIQMCGKIHAGHGQHAHVAASTEGFLNMYKHPK